MSRFVVQLLERLFPDSSAEAVSPRRSKPYLIEGLHRSANFTVRFENWEAEEWNDVSGFLVEDVKNAMSTGKSQRISLHYFNGAGGALLDVSILPEETAVFIMEKLKNQIKRLGYRIQQADRQFFDKPDGIERKDRYYLKPPFTEDVPANQLFGNILIELIVEDRSPRVLKLQANTYHDAQYLPPLPFNELLLQVLSKD